MAESGGNKEGVYQSAEVYMSDESIPVAVDDEEEFARAREEWGIKESGEVESMEGSGKEGTRHMVVPPMTKEGDIIRMPNRYKVWKRTVADREKDRTIIMKHYLEGMPYSQISIKLAEERPYQLSIAQISVEVQNALRAWQLSYLDDTNTAKIRELLKLDHVEQELWDTWEKSQEDIIEYQQTVVIGKNDPSTEEIEAEEEEIEAALEGGFDENGRAIREKKAKKVRKGAGKRIPGGGEPGSQSAGKGFTRTRIFEKRISSYGDIRILEQIRLTIEMRAKILGLITNRSKVDVSWRKEAEKLGLDPTKVIDDITQRFIEEGMAKGNGGGEG